MALLALSLTWANSITPSSAGIPISPLKSPCRDTAKQLTQGTNNDGEPSVVIPQSDPGRLVAAWTANGPPPTGLSPIQGEVTIAQAKDGVWDEPETIAHYPSGDPWLDTSPDGDTYVAYVGIHRDIKPGPQTWVRRISPGQAAGPPSAGFFLLDRPTVAVWQQPRERERIYLAGMFPWYGARSAVAVSENGGDSWLRPQLFPPPLPESKTEQASPVVETGGTTVIIAWTEELDDDLLGTTTAIRTARIDPASALPDLPITVAETIGERKGLPFSAGVTPMLAVVRQGALAGKRAYLVWPQRSSRIAGQTQIMLSYTDDGGLSWSWPAQVNDVANTPVFPSVAALPDGEAFVAWFDTRNDRDHAKARIYGSRVDSNGAPGANIQISKCPSYEESYSYHLGDYFGIDADQSKVAIAFPRITLENKDSDVFFQYVQ